MAPLIGVVTRFVVRCGIDSISVAPDSCVAVKQHVAAAEQDRPSCGSAVRLRTGVPFP
ncbi:hypothetical protein P3T36_006564 [Kitasatospora sp. MAP12-15]|uniref:hypothetical protein n=1 Tax=unclassified Kitasatospora TaxID=2633591 RepID=UPI0024758C7B|nr:hypothetical protein [Kitasatospora sp. MAP12-44]MDH6115494.1 hypothetical protein [Kitasatospora sp. MAP12-44]